MLFEGDIVTNVRLDEVRNALGAQASCLLLPGR
jgi:hypothetical protein